MKVLLILVVAVTLAQAKPQVRAGTRDTPSVTQSTTPGPTTEMAVPTSTTEGMRSPMASPVPNSTTERMWSIAAETVSTSTAEGMANALPRVILLFMIEPMTPNTPGAKWFVSSPGEPSWEQNCTLPCIEGVINGSRSFQLNMK